MKWLGLIGGTTWHSTQVYYSLLNKLANVRGGGLTSARCILVSLDFAEVAKNQAQGELEPNEPLILDAADRLKAAGAEGIVLCANTMHHFTDRVEKRTGLPVIHIVDAVAQAIKAQGLSKVALLGTKFTMELDFFRDRLNANGIEWLIPNDEDRQLIHDSVFEELGKGIFSDATRVEYVRVIEGMAAQGAQGVILGCTEIPLLVRPGDVSVPTFDTTALHVEAASAFAFT